MTKKSLEYFLTTVKAPLNHPLFFPRVFALMAKECKNSRIQSNRPYPQIICEEYDELSRRYDRSQIQESCSARTILRTRQLADILIDEKGEIRLSILPELIEQLKKNLYSLGPQRQYDAKRQEHILSVLEHLANNKQIVLLLKKISRPLSNRLAEDLIRQTLQLDTTTTTTDIDAKKAVLTAWMCLLRQNVGSCFATAPAEIIQSEQPETFLQDMIDLLGACRLKRTFGGVEYAVPLSDSWGNGDLKKPIILRLSTKGILPEIWTSPGLIAAFEAVNLLKKEDSIKLKNQQLQAWIQPLAFHGRQIDSTFITTAEDLIRIILLQSFDLTEKQLEEYNNRPRDLIHSHMLPYSKTPPKKTGSIKEKCNAFIYQFETAKNTFKALTDNALLKAWEFTLASFSETKLEFTTWNLYASLGMGTHEPGGIGQCIQQFIQNKLDYVNREAQEIQYECEAMFTQVKTLESRIRHASTEKEIEWLKIEYQSRKHEYYFMEEQKDMLQFQAQTLVNLYDVLYNSYIELFKDYFQEVYDADMQEVESDPFDDSPAGFRLLYKHGRTNPSQWTRIRNLSEFIDALAAFFVATEPHIASTLEKKNIEKDLAETVTAIINHIKTKEFQESAFQRMSSAHQAIAIHDPLNNIAHIQKKPWAYTSGGTMNTLVNCYYGIGDKPDEAAKWIENEMELLVFIADTLKQIPESLLRPFISGQKSSMLMQSPTHAFLLKPANHALKECWMNDEFTYTFIRDRYVKPAEMFVRQVLLNDEMIELLLQELMEKVPENYQPRFRSVFAELKGPLTPLFFREALVDTIHQDRGLKHGRMPVLATAEIDSLLYSHLPLFSLDELPRRVRKIMNLLPGLNEEEISEIMGLLDQIPISRNYTILSANQLQDICKSLLCLINLSTTSPHNYHWHISLAAQQLGYAMPTPVIFADTNWVKEEFGFVVNPGTGYLELWRLDYTGSSGYPMTNWKEWLNGSRQDLKWGIYVKPTQYGQG